METSGEGWRVSAFVAELAFIFAIEGQKCESEETQWKQMDGRVRQVFDYLYLLHSMIRNAGIGLFTAHELLRRTLFGYYCGVLIWSLGLMLSYDEHMVIETWGELTNAYTILMQDSKGEWVTVSPGGCGEPSLYMGFQFMNDIGLSFDDETENQSRVCHVMYNTQITEDGCVYTTRMIAKGMELLCTYVQE